MQAMMEVTEWASDVDAGSISHLYWMDGDVALAYCKAGTVEPIYFSRPFHMDLRGRKFVKVRVHPFQESTDQCTNIVKIKSSNSKETYVVDLDAQTCTCRSFSFRGNCKHIDLAKEQHDV